VSLNRSLRATDLVARVPPPLRSLSSTLSKGAGERGSGTDEPAKTSRERAKGGGQ
jgi:hypothetical protein